MADETNDMKPTDPGKKIPPSLGRQMGNFMTEGELESFRSQLPKAFLDDASEGLNQIQDGTQLEAMLKQLNRQMHQQLKSRKKRSGRKMPGDLRWAYWAILIILLLAVCTFIIIRMLLNH
jgi:hypothetical protein